MVSRKNARQPMRESDSDDLFKLASRGESKQQVAAGARDFAGNCFRRWLFDREVARILSSDLKKEVLEKIGPHPEIGGGAFTCPKCSGSGILPIYNEGHYSESSFTNIKCETCKGKKVVNGKRVEAYIAMTAEELRYGKIRHLANEVKEQSWHDFELIFAFTPIFFIILLLFILFGSLEIIFR